jgi:hydrogenase maturation protease
MTTAVIGVGSSFGDDNIADRMIMALQVDISLNPSLENTHFHYYDRPSWQLLEYMKPFQTVHLVDALCSNQPIGTVQCYQDISLFQQEKNLLSSHAFGLADTLALGQVLAQLPENLFIHTIEISMDSTVAISFDEVYSRLVDQIISLMKVN